MADWSKPTLGDLYSNFLSYLSGRLTDVACMFRGVTPTNFPNGTVRFNDTTAMWEVYNSTAGTWSPLCALYGINVSKLNGALAASPAAAGQIPMLDANGNLLMAGLQSLLLGSGVSGKETNAGTIGYQKLSTALDIVGAGQNTTARLIKLWAEGGLTVTGPININGQTVFYPGNMGAGSGLDADKLHGALPGSGAGMILLLDASGLVPVACIPPSVVQLVNGKAPISITGDAQTLQGLTPAQLEATNRAIWTTPGTYNWTAPAGVTTILATLIGGGGGGGGVLPSNIAGTYRAPGGGGANAVIKTPLPVVPGNVYQIIVGLGGAGGSSTPTNGSTGSSSSVQYNGGVFTMLGGGGGQGANNGTPGIVGNNFGVGGTAGTPTYGGGSMYGVGAPPAALNSSGNSASAVGAAGSGGCASQSMPGQVGGSGGNGLVIIEW